MASPKARQCSNGSNQPISTSISSSFFCRWFKHIFQFSSKQLTKTRSSKPASRFAEWKSNWITNWWLAELLCWLIATLSLVGIIITLESFKHKPVPKWGLGLTLNSLISVLATTSQMAMMKPIVEGISQLKWLWFMRKERIMGFQAFDDASRGPTGSLLLLGTIRGMHLVTLGAALTVVAVAFGPFTQQVVTYPLDFRPGGVASVPQAFNYTGATSRTAENPGLEAAIWQGLSQNNLNLSAVVPNCITGNCTWSPYQSLGVCATVQDVSSHVIRNSCNTTFFESLFESAFTTNPGYSCFNYTLPEIGYPTDTDPTPNVSLSNASPDVAPPGNLQMMTITSVPPNSTSLYTAYLMYQPNYWSSINSSLPSPVAYVLNLDFCVHTYNTTVLNSVVNTTKLSSSILPAQINNTAGRNDASVTISGKNSSITLRNDTFGSTDVGSATLTLLLSDSLDDQCYNFMTFLDNVDPGLAPDWCAENIGPFFGPIENSTNHMSAVAELLDRLAISLSNFFRLGADGDTQTGTFDGTVFVPVITVDSNYLWLVLPIGLVGLTLVFLLATISKSQRLGSRVWKSSNLATLQGLHMDVHRKLGGLSSISDMEERAKDLRVGFAMAGGAMGRDVEYRLAEMKQEEYWRG